MRSQKTAHRVALASGIGVFALMVLLAKLRGWMPFAVGGFAYLGLLIWLWPKKSPEPAEPPELPEGVTPQDHHWALTTLEQAVEDLRADIPKAPLADEPLLTRMAELIDAIHGHHVANPAHVHQTRLFLRHTLGRMIDAVRTYVDLTARSGAAHEDRAKDVSAQLETFVPALERVERACIENDFDAVEIDIEILNEQMGRRR